MVVFVQVQDYVRNRGHVCICTCKSAHSHEAFTPYYAIYSVLSHMTSSVKYTKLAENEIMCSVFFN